MPSENIISRFWELASNDETTRLKAASQLLDSLHEAQMHHEEKVEVKNCMFSLVRTLYRGRCKTHVCVIFRVGDMNFPEGRRSKNPP